MKETEFNSILKRAQSYAFSSMDYIDYDDVAGYDIIADNKNLILLYGFDQEAGYHLYTSIGFMPSADKSQIDMIYEKVKEKEANDSCQITKNV